MLKAGSPTLKGFFDTFSIDLEKPVTIIDKYTWEINLTRPDYGLFSVWAAPHPFGKIYDSEEIKKHASADDPWGNQWLKTHVAGFGPWTIEKYSPGKELELKRNPNYHRPGIPRVDLVVFKEVPSDATRAALLRSGTVDLALGLSPRLIEPLRSAPGIKTIDISGNEWMVWLLNNGVPPFDDVRVRRAMAHAAPIKEILKTVYLAKPWVARWDGYAPHNYMGAPVAWPYDEDPEKARALLKEAGKENLKFDIVYETNVAGSEEIAVIIKSQLAKIGVEVELKGLAPAQYSEQYRARRAQSVLFRDASWGSDGRYWLSTFFHTQGAVNHGNHRNPEFDKVVDEMTPVTDLAARTALSKKAHEILVQDAPWAFAIGIGFSVPMRNNMDGFVWRLNNWVDTRDLSKK
jgi:peptide/nickel transport system substrate-binding protein